MKKHKKNEQIERDRIENDRRVDIEPYAPHQAIGPERYYEPTVMTELKNSFEAHVLEFLDKTDPDQYNATYVDAVVNRAKHQALNDLGKQKLEHIRVIERVISSLWKGDEHYYKRLLENYEDEYKERDNELKTLKAIYQKKTALEKGEC